MKEIVLIDRAVGQKESIAEKIIDNTDYVIRVLVVDTESQKKCFDGEPRVKQVVTVSEIDNYSSVRGLSFDIIRSCKGAQLLVENALTRYDNDYNRKKYVYYCGLSFWSEFFEGNKIDLIFINGVIHGLPYDGILRGMSDRYNIPLYSCYCFGVNYWNSIICDELNHKIIQVDNVAVTKSVDEYLSNGKIDVLNCDFYGTSNDDGKKKNKNGYNGLLFKKIGPLGKELISSVIHGTLFKKKRISASGFYTSTLQRLKCFLDLKNAQFYLQKKECQLDCERKYIYFSLHFEPEGSTQCSLTMESQLVAIKMLSECIPDDWVIYVKEHPHQFKINTPLFEYYIHNCNLFKTQKFYGDLLSIPKVKIVSHKYHSSVLLDNSQAVASLIGSVFFEAIKYKKPILLFSEYHPLAHNDEVLNCLSFSECMNSVNKIVEGYTPTYNSVMKTFNTYICASEDDFIRNRLIAIKNNHVDE